LKTGVYNVLRLSYLFNASTPEDRFISLFVANKHTFVNISTKSTEDFLFFHIQAINNETLKTETFVNFFALPRNSQFNCFNFINNVKALYFEREWNSTFSTACFGKCAKNNFNPKADCANKIFPDPDFLWLNNTEIDDLIKNTTGLPPENNFEVEVLFYQQQLSLMNQSINCSTNSSNSSSNSNSLTGTRTKSVNISYSSTRRNRFSSSISIHKNDDDDNFNHNNNDNNNENNNIDNSDDDNKIKNNN